MPGDTPPPAFIVEGATKLYGREAVVADLALEIAAGEHVAVIGPSGAGKTTLFRLLAGAIRPSAGRVVALGRDTARLRGRALRALRREVGVIHQTDNLIPGLRVVHNVLMGRLGWWSLPRALLSLLFPQEVGRARAALREVELEARLHALPGELSGGEQQRVACARLIVQEPRAVLADEPVSQLDLRLGREVVRILARIADARGAALVVNLHGLDLLDGPFDRVVALKNGRLFWQGRPREITQKLLHDLYGAEYRALRLDELELSGPGSEPREP